jgi:hypothetical protein
MSAARAISCPSCGGTIEIKAAGYSVTVACQYCGSVLDVANLDVRLIAEYHLAAGATTLPLGKRGSLFGVEWEAIGYVIRSDGDANWTEYLLFNPYAGYRWLVLSEGEWQFGTMLLDRPKSRGSEMVRWRERIYQQDYSTLTTTTDRVVGEFYWRVQAGDQVTGSTFSNKAGETLSLERTKDEVNWTHLVPVMAETVHAAFDLPPPPKPSFTKRMSEDFGSADTMDSRDLPAMIGMAICSAFLIFIIMIVFGFSTARINGLATVVVGDPERSVTLGTITASRPRQFVTVNARASSFVNRWVDIDYSLIDRKTQQSINAYSVVEYYTGRDSDGNWSEGDRSARTLFASVPAGTYDLVADVSAHQWSSTYYDTPSVGEEINLSFRANVGGVSWGNYILLCLLLFAPPVIILIWRHHT